MKNEVIKGSFILIFAGLIGKMLGAIYRIPLSNILGAEGIGVYQMIFPVFSLALIICSGGVSITIAHSVAKIRASGEGSIKQVFLKGFLYTLISSVIFAILFIILGEKIAILQGNALASAGYKVCAIALIFSSLLASFRGLFQGFQNMIPTATSQILEQVFKVVFGLIFAYFFVGTSLELGVVGAFLGITIAEIISFFYLLIKAKNFRFNIVEKPKTINFLKTNFFITASYLIIPLLTVFDSFVVINILSNTFSAELSTSLYGIQSGMVNSLINFPVVISVAISLAVLPELSFCLSQNNFDVAKEKIVKIFTFLIIILIPCITIFVFFAGDIMNILYTSLDINLISMATLLLQVSSFQIIFISLLQICTAIFQSLDKPAMPIFILSASGVFKIILTLILVSLPNFNILGLAISNLVFYSLVGLSSVYFVKKKIPFFLPIKTLIVCLSSLLILMISFILINIYFTNIFAKIILIGLATLTLYIIPLILFDILKINALIKEKLKNWKINKS